MRLRLRTFGACSIGLTLALLSSGTADAQSAYRAPPNRSMESVHQPTVSRTDYVLDVGATPTGLAPGEAARLSGWFDGLVIGYGDSITIDRSALWHASAAADGVAAVVSHYGMLVSNDAPPVTVGHPAPGSLRVIVSRAVATVEGCPDWSRGSAGEYAGSSQSNYGCASALNIAAMIANPEDLVEGHAGNGQSDPRLSVRAIKAYKDAAVSGGGGTVVKSDSAGGN